jgi:type I restriction enzyme S subunit
MSNWLPVLLTEIYEISSGLSKSADSFGTGYPFLSFKDVFGNYFVPNELSQLVESTEKEREKGSIKKGDVFLTRTSETMHELGLSSVALKDYPDATFNGFTKRLRLKEDALHEVHPEFIGYCLRSPQFRRGMLAFSTMSTRASLNNDMISRLSVELPPIDTQKSIARVLKSLDEKIQVNRQTNQTLEQMAQAIFKSWFVDFEPTHAKIAAKLNDQDPERAAMAAISGKTVAELDQLSPNTQQQLRTTAALFPDKLVGSELDEIPEGWEVACIDDVCDFQNGYAFKSKEMTKSPIGTYKVFKMGHIKKGGGLNQTGTKDYYEKVKCEKLDRYLVKKGDLLMCMTDMKNNVALLGHTALMDVSDEYILNQRVGLLRTKNTTKANYPFLYILTNSKTFLEDLRSRANSGVQVNLSTKAIKETKFILPSESVHVAFDQVVERWEEQIFSLEAEQEYLSEIRDSLLPKLLSGELNISTEA